MLFDTDILIWYFRGNSKARQILNHTDKITISAVTLMELIQGIRDKKELYMLNKMLAVKAVRVYYINEQINLHAVHLLEGYTLSDGIELADALIAATSLHYGEEILT